MRSKRSRFNEPVLTGSSTSYQNSRMPRGAAHWKVGKWIGVLTPIGLFIFVNNGVLPSGLFVGQPSLFEGLTWWIFYYPLAIGLTIVGAMLADILEPAFIYGPGHRGFFHSSWVLGGLFVFAIAVLYGWILGSPGSYYLRNILFFIALGYLSHLLLDYIFS